MKHNKTWALSVANIGVILTTLASLFVTSSPWVLISLLLIPLNLVLWQWTRRGIMVVEYDDEHDVEVVFETIEESDCGDNNSGRGCCTGRGSRNPGDPKPAT